MSEGAQCRASKGTRAGRGGKKARRLSRRWTQGWDAAKVVVETGTSARWAMGNAGGGEGGTREEGDDKKLSRRKQCRKEIERKKGDSDAAKTMTERLRSRGDGNDGRNRSVDGTTVGGVFGGAERGRRGKGRKKEGEKIDRIRMVLAMLFALCLFWLGAREATTKHTHATHTHQAAN